MAFLQISLMPTLPCPDALPSTYPHPPHPPSMHSIDQIASLPRCTWTLVVHTRPARRLPQHASSLLGVTLCPLASPVWERFQDFFLASRHEPSTAVIGRGASHSPLLVFARLGRMPCCAQALPALGQHGCPLLSIFMQSPRPDVTG